MPNLEIEKPCDKKVNNCDPAKDAFKKLHAEYERSRDAGADSKDKHDIKIKSADDKHEQEWTVVVDLTANKYFQPQDPNGKVTEIGAADKIKRLKEMAAETKNKPVTMIVQWANNGEPHLQRDGEIKLGDGDKNAPAQLERYRIKNGEIEQLPSPKDKGFSQNLAELADAAMKENPSRRVALFLNADGGGNVGFRGADGTATLDDVTRKLKNSLQKNNRDKFDIVDYDCCLMAQDGSVKKTAEITDSLVASAETERCVKGADGQNLTASMRELLKNPGMSGSEFARQIVEQAKNGANDLPPRDKSGKASEFESGTNTLAAFDLTQEKALADKVDKFGTELSAACQDPATRAAIDSIIKKIGKYCDDKGAPDADLYQNRDVKLFAEEVIKAAQNKSDSNNPVIKDETHKLQNSAEELLRSLSDVTLDKRGRDVENGPLAYDKAGCLSVFLPEKGFYDKEQAVKDRLDTMNHMIESSYKRGIDSHDPEMFDACARGLVCMGLGDFRGMFKDGAMSTESQEFWKTVDKMSQAQTHEQFVGGMEAVRKAMNNLRSRAEFDAALTKEANRLEKAHRDRWKEQANLNEPGWNQFVETLIHG